MGVAIPAVGAHGAMRVSHAQRPASRTRGVPCSCLARELPVARVRQTNRSTIGLRDWPRSITARWTSYPRTVNAVPKRPHAQHRYLRRPDGGSQSRRAGRVPPALGRSGERLCTVSSPELWCPGAVCLVRQRGPTTPAREATPTPGARWIKVRKIQNENQHHAVLCPKRSVNILFGHVGVGVASALVHGRTSPCRAIRTARLHLRRGRR